MRSSRVVALALVVGTFFVAQEVLTDLANGTRIRIANDVIVVLLFWIVWACLTPVILIALRRWPLDDRPAYRPLLAHAAIAVTLAAAHHAITLSLRSLARYVGGTITLGAAFRQTASLPAFIWGEFTGAFFYAVAVMVYTAVRYRSLYVTEQLGAAALQTELSRATLDTLRSQLRPHFLFNTLNAISVAVTENPRKAEEMLLRLSSLLRRSLDEQAHEVPLHQELAFMNDYLEIQQGRFGDQLRVQRAIDPAALNALIPVFLLQPLLENAIEHGKTEGRCTSIALGAAPASGMLQITLTDNGPGVGRGAPVREGIGLGNTRARLHQLYGPAATVEITSAGAHDVWPGTHVEIRIPFRERPE